MERLTKKSGEMVWLKRDGLCLEPCEIDSSAAVREVLVKLAAYEDTGLTPKEVLELASEVDIWKSGYQDLVKISKNGISQINEAIEKLCSISQARK